MRDRTLLNNRDEQIRKEYAKKAAIKIGNVELYRHKAILEMLSQKFFLLPGTIEKIVAKEAEPNNQLPLFPEE